MMDKDKLKLKKKTFETMIKEAKEAIEEWEIIIKAFDREIGK